MIRPKIKILLNSNPSKALFAFFSPARRPGCVPGYRHLSAYRPKDRKGKNSTTKPCACAPAQRCRICFRSRIFPVVPPHARHPDHLRTPLASAAALATAAAAVTASAERIDFAQFAVAAAAVRGAVVDFSYFYSTLLPALALPT